MIQPPRNKADFQTSILSLKIAIQLQIVLKSLNDHYQCLDIMYNKVYNVEGYRVVLEKVKRAQICMATKMSVHHMIQFCLLYTSDGKLHDEWKRRQIFVMSCSCSVAKL